MNDTLLNFESDKIDYENVAMFIQQFGSVYFVYNYSKPSPVRRFIETYIPNDLFYDYKETFHQFIVESSKFNTFKVDTELSEKISINFKNKKIADDYFDVFVSLEELTTKVFVKKYKKLIIDVNNWQDLTFIKNEHTKSLNIECFGMKNLDWLENYPNLENLSITILKSEEKDELNNIDGLKYVENLKELFLGGAKNKEFLDLSPLIALQKIEALNLFHCSQIKDLNILKDIPSLDPKNVSVRNCDELADISFFINETNHLETSKEINFLPKVKFLGDLSKIKQLEFNGGFSNDIIYELKKYPSIEQITIDISDGDFHLNGGVIDANFVVLCRTIKLSGDSIKNLELYSSYNNDLTGISNLPNLENLIISVIPECLYSKKIISLAGIEKLTSLKSLRLEGIPYLASIEGIEHCLNLESLSITSCKNLVDTSPIAKLKKLEHLNLSNCKSLALKPKPTYMNREELLKYQMNLLNFIGEKVDKEMLEEYETIKLSKPKKYSPTLVQKIKRLLNSGDINLIDSGLTLIKGLNEPKLFETLLNDVFVYEHGEVDLQDFLRGKIENKPFKNYIFLQLSKMVSVIDQWKPLCESIQKWDKPIAKQGPLDQFVNLKSLNLNGFSKSEFSINNNAIKKIDIYDKGLSFDITHLAGCNNCEELSIRVDTILNGLEEVKNLEKLNKLRVEFNNFENHNQSGDSFFKPISNCNQLTFLSINFNKTGNNRSNPVSDATFLSKLTKIHTLNLNGISFSNDRFLNNYTSLNDLNISNNPLLETLILPKIEHAVKFNKLIKLNNITATEKSDISTIDIRECKSLKNLDFLSLITTKKEIYLSLSGCYSLEDISGISHLLNTSISLETEKIPNIGKSEYITYFKSETIKSLKRIEQFVNLLNLDLSSNKNLMDISDLEKVDAIDSLNLRNCVNLKTLKGLKNCKINYLNLCDTTSLEDIKDLEFMDLQKIYIAGSSIKKADIPKRLIPVLDWRARP